jgi:hypothetical protein
MAKFRCGAAGRRGETEYDETNHGSPVCDPPDVVFLLAIEEVPDEVLNAFASFASEEEQD